MAWHFLHSEMWELVRHRFDTQKYLLDTAFALIEQDTDASDQSARGPLSRLAGASDIHLGLLPSLSEADYDGKVTHRRPLLERIRAEKPMATYLTPLSHSRRRGAPEFLPTEVA